MALIDENGHINLYVSGLPRGMSEEQFAQLFTGTGSVVSTKCVPEKRYGFVKYANLAEASAIIDAMNGQEFQGTLLVVKFAHPDEARGLKGVGSTLAEFPERQLQHQMAGWGSAAVQPGTFDLQQSLMQLQAGTLPIPDLSGGLSQEVVASLSKLASQVGVEVPTQDCVHIKGLPQDISDSRVRTVFSAYGRVVQTKLARYTDGCSAFVRMGSPEMALWLTDNLSGNIPQGLSAAVQVTFADQAKFANCSSSNARAAPYGNGSKIVPVANAGHPKFDNFSKDVQTGLNCVMAALGGKAGAGTGSVILTVKDLPGTADDLYVYKTFAPFGALESVSVKRDPEGHWAVAFIKYLAADGAERAVVALNGCVLPDGTTLTVSLKTSAAK